MTEEAELSRIILKFSSDAYKQQTLPDYKHTVSIEDTILQEQSILFPTIKTVLTILTTNQKQVDITISKNQALQILYLV